MTDKMGKYHYKDYTFCDWYSGTINEGVDNIIETLCDDLGGTEIRPTAGPPQYDACHGIFSADPNPEPLLIVAHGGNNDAAPHFRARGFRAEAACRLIRQHFPVHKVSRLDVAIDFIEPGIYELISGKMAAIHKRSGIRTRTINHDVPEMGRTHYLGARSSRVMTRLYEKDKQLEQAGKSFALGHTRLEAEIKPKGSADRLKWASVGLEDAWGGSPATAQLVREVLSLGPEPIRREPQKMRSEEERLINLLTQYRRLLGNIGRDRVVELVDQMFTEGTNSLTPLHENRTTH